MIAWKIFYQDSTYSSDDGRPENAPKTGVQAIAVRDDLVGRRIESSENHYIWTPKNGGWRGVDKFGLYDYLIDDGFKIVMFGRTLSDDEYRRVWDMVSNDIDLPPKSGRLPSERRR